MPTTPPTITPLPDPPNPNDRSTFNTLAYPWSLAQQTLATEQGAVATNVYDNAVEAEDSAVAADAAAATAVAAALQATSSPSAGGTSTTSNSIGTGSKSWTLAQTGLAFYVGQRVYAARTSDSANQRMTGIITAYNSGTGSITVNMSTAVGSGTFTDWTIASTGEGGAPVEIKQRTITGADTIIASDRGKVIKFTGGSNATLAFTAAATLGDGFFCYLQNASQADLTLDPSGSEQIDGLTSYPSYPFEARLLYCDGSAFYTIVLNGYRKVFTASGTWTKPPGYSAHAGEAIGAGGSGARITGAGASAGAGGGAGIPFSVSAAALAASEAVTVGTGGAAITGSNVDGQAGGSTSFGAWSTGFGGGGGYSGSGNGGGGGGAFSAGTTTTGQGGSPRVVSAANPGMGGGDYQQSSINGGGGGAGGSGLNAGNSLTGGGGGGGVSNSGIGGTPGTSKTAGNGGAGGFNTNGTAGSVPGGGGGSTYNGTQSGAGGRGELRISGVI